MRATQGFLVIADISGYTQFVRSHNLRHVPILGEKMRRTSERHAETVITDLMEVIIDALGETMSVNKLEGDAIFFVHESDNPGADAVAIMPRVLNIFDAFHRRLYELIYCQACLCDCCHQMGELKVKIIAHFGSFMVKRVAHFEEVAGEDVILVHRLLKNTLDSNEYLMITAAMQKFAAPVVKHLTFESHVENLDLGEVNLAVHYPDNPSVMRASSIKNWWSHMRQMQSYFANDRQRIDLGVRVSS